MNEINFRGKTIFYSERDNYWRSIERGEWEPDSFDVLDKYIKPGTNFIDIGAWVGGLAIYASMLGATVYAVEPDEPAYDELLRSLRNNNTVIFTLPIAISDHNGWGKLNSRTPDGFGNSESSLIKRDECAIEKDIQTITLSDCVRGIESPFIKIDVEGGEKDIIRNAASYVSAEKPQMFISFHPAWLTPSEIEMMIGILFPIYEFSSSKNLNASVSEDEFRSLLKSDHEHSFVLIPKL